MGLGYATMSVIGPSATIAPWFEKHQGRAVAMALTGASVGAMVVVPLRAGFLLEAHGPARPVQWRMAETRGETAAAAPPFGAPGQYDDNGVDLSLIRENLRVSPTERARRAERARRDALGVQAIGRAVRAKPA
jgi:MFS family permease